MVSGGDHVDAEIEKLFGNWRCQAETSGCVLSVGNAEIDVVLPQ
jgi:hypothetical protein